MPWRRSVARAPASMLFTVFHDVVIKWKHFPCNWPFVRGIRRSTVNSPHKGEWREALLFSLIRAWINGWVYNHEASVSRRQCAHYDVVTMEPGHFGPRTLGDKPSYFWDQNLSDELYQYHGRSVRVWQKMRIYCFKCPISENIHKKNTFISPRKFKIHAEPQTKVYQFQCAQ